MARYLITFILLTWLRLVSSSKIEAPLRHCTCAIFEVSKEEPLIQHVLPIAVPCDVAGAASCSRFCTALAESAKDSAPSLICEELKEHVDNLRVAVYSKSCFDAAWRFSGLESPRPICCHAGKEKACDCTHRSPEQAETEP